MIRAFSCFLALRYLFSRRINVLGTIGVAVAVWALIVVIAVFSGFISEIRENIRSATPELLLTSLKQDTSYKEISAIIADDPNVESIAPRLRHYAIYFPYGRPSRAQMTRALQTTSLHFEYIELIGVDPDLEAQAKQLEGWVSGIVRDRRYPVGHPRRDPDSRQIVADPEHPLTVPLEDERKLLPDVAPGELLSASPGLLLGHDRLRSGGMVRGQEVSLVTVRTHDDGELDQVRRIHAISGSFQTKHGTFDDTRGIVPIETLRDMLGQSEYTDSIDIITGVAIELKDSADLRGSADRIEALVSDQFGGKVLTWEEQNSTFLAAVDQERGMMKLILFAVMLVSAFLIYATLQMMVTHKIKDIGIITSMGAGQSGVLHIFLLTGIIIAVIGCTLGVSLGCLSAIYLNDANDFTKANLGFELFPTKIYSMDVIPYRLELTWIIQVVVGALITTLFSAWLPARKAARMEPVKALAKI